MYILEITKWYLLWCMINCHKEKDYVFSPVEDGLSGSPFTNMVKLRLECA